MSSLRQILQNPERPFIIAFMILIVIAAVELALGYENAANKIAEIAYIYLVIGVILTIYSILREERKRRREK